MSESNEQDSLGLAIQYLIAKEQFKDKWKKEHGVSSLRRILSEGCSQVGEGVTRNGYEIFLTKTTRHLIPEAELEKHTKVSEERLSIRKSTKGR